MPGGWGAGSCVTGGGTGQAFLGLTSGDTGRTVRRTAVGVEAGAFWWLRHQNGQVKWEKTRSFFPFYLRPKSRASLGPKMEEIFIDFHKDGIRCNRTFHGGPTPVIFCFDFDLGGLGSVRRIGMGLDISWW